MRVLDTIKQDRETSQRQNHVTWDRNPLWRHVGDRCGGSKPLDRKVERWIPAFMLHSLSYCKAIRILSRKYIYVVFCRFINVPLWSFLHYFANTSFPELAREKCRKIISLFILARNRISQHCPPGSIDAVKSNGTRDPWLRSLTSIKFNYKFALDSEIQSNAREPVQVKPKGAISSQGEPSKRKAGETRRFGGKMLDDVIRVDWRDLFWICPSRVLFAIWMRLPCLPARDEMFGKRKEEKRYCNSRRE